MKKLYSFLWDCRGGGIEGLFIAQEDDVNAIIGQEVYFGEVLGKHSEVYGPIEKEEIKVISEDQELIDKLCVVFGFESETGTLSGYNPLDYI